MDDPAWFTLTHARLRASQGDRRGSRRILAEILRRSPGDREASLLLRSLEGLPDRPQPGEGLEPLSRRRAADPGSLAPGFRAALGSAFSRRTERRRRIERLRAWLDELDAS